nr:hypothetical protein [Micromonospora sp. DSM 115978]
MSLWRRSAALAGAAVATLAVTACGSATGSSEVASPPSVLELLASDLKGSLQKTIDTTDRAESVTLTMRGTMAGESVSMQGVVDLRDPVKAEMTTTDADGTATTIRMIGAVIYVEIPESERATADGKRWMKLDLSATAAQAGVDYTDQLDEVDPVRQVKTLLAMDGTTVVGEETVNGVRTVHYTNTSPLATYLGQLDAEARAAAEKGLAEQDITEVTIDLWVDEQYQPRRATVLMGTVSDLTIDYTDYGKPVTVEAPAAAETTDLAEMLEGLADLAAGN